MADVFVGGGYRFTDWCSVTAGYRFLHEEYDRNDFVLKSDIQGVCCSESGSISKSPAWPW